MQPWRRLVGVVTCPSLSGMFPPVSRFDCTRRKHLARSRPLLANRVSCQYMPLGQHSEFISQPRRLEFHGLYNKLPLSLLQMDPEQFKCCTASIRAFPTRGKPMKGRGRRQPSATLQKRSLQKNPGFSTVSHLMARHFICQESQNACRAG